MKIIHDFINSYGLAIIYAVLTAIAGFLGAQFKRIYENKINDDLKKKIVKTCVKAVEQMYHDLSGTEKYEKAVESISEMLAAKGIEITDLEIRMLIEAAVCEFNIEAWKDDSDG